MFPVKLTEPLTAILYITQDREHIEELRHAIHVKEVAEGRKYLPILNNIAIGNLTIELLT